MRLFGMADYDQAAIRTMWRLDRSVFAPPFDANTLLDRLEPSSAIQAFIAGNSDFDDADPVGELYSRLYAHLDPPRKLVCFRRICSTAVTMHRYSVMQDVRNVYGSETDPAIRGYLMSILDQEDPSHVVQGRGVLPRSP